MRDIGLHSAVGSVIFLVVDVVVFAVVIDVFVVVVIDVVIIIVPNVVVIVIVDDLGIVIVVVVLSYKMSSIGVALFFSFKMSHTAQS